MKHMTLTLSAAAMLAMAGVVSAEDQLSAAQMDGITAGGIAEAVAAAEALGNTAAFEEVITAAAVVPVDATAGELGAIYTILSEAFTSSEALADDDAYALGIAEGTASGSGDADVFSESLAAADSTAAHSAVAEAASAAVATSVLVGEVAFVSNEASSVAALGDAVVE